MEKKDFKNLVQDLNNQCLSFIHLANKNENPYFYLFSISFKMIRREMYLGQFPVMTNLLQISIKRLQSKNKNHIIIDIENPKSTDKLSDWNLPEDVQINILKSIAKFSNKVVYLKELKCLVES